MQSFKSLTLFCAFFPAAAYSQSHCSVQPPPPAATQADTTFAAGDFARAESLYNSQASSAPTAAAYAGLVHSQLAQNKLGDAAKSAAQAAAALPKSGDALALNGEVLLRSGQIPQAFTALTQASAIDPCSARAHLGVARLDLMVSRGSVATHELATAHSLAPSDPDVTAAWLESLGDTERATALQTLLDSKPQFAPSKLAMLRTQLDILQQHKSCTAFPYTTAELNMYPLMISGTHPRSWALKAQIDGADLPLLEMDTSVSGIVLNPKDAKKAGVHPLRTLPDSPDEPYAAYADKIRIGSVEYHDCPVQVVPARELGNLNSLVGLDFFRDHLVHIDYVTMQVTLAPLPVDPHPVAGTLTDRYIADEEKTWSPAYKSDANLIVPTFVNKKGPYLFAIDTGSWRTIFAPSAGKVVSCLHDSTLLFKGVSGPIFKVLPMDGAENDYSNVRTLSGAPVKVAAPDSVADLRWAGVDYISQVPLCVDISAKSQATGVELSGLIGFADLSPFFIDLNYRDGLIHLKFDEMRKYDSREQLRDK